MVTHHRRKLLVGGCIGERVLPVRPYSGTRAGGIPKRQEEEGRLRTHGEDHSAARARKVSRSPRPLMAALLMALQGGTLLALPARADDAAIRQEIDALKR